MRAQTTFFLNNTKSGATGFLFFTKFAAASCAAHHLFGADSAPSRPLYILLTSKRPPPEFLSYVTGKIRGVAQI
jgi:hypothetical protein